MLDRFAAEPPPGLPSRIDAIERPAAWRRAAAGAWYVIGGFSFLLRNPALWGLAALPALLGFLLMLGGGVLVYVAFPAIESRVLPSWDRIPDVLRFLMMLVLWAGTVLAGMLAGFALAVLLTSPMLERLSRLVEARARGEGAAAGWDVVRSAQGGGWALAASPGVFVLSLVPAAGPLAAALWAAYALAFQHADPPLTRRGLDFTARRAWHRRWLAESLGFGLAGVVALTVPLANLLLAPALATGATLYVLEVEALARAAPAPSAEPLAAR
jgi:uncharacterized protein involved in cysteine biosynthesis